MSGADKLFRIRPVRAADVDTVADLQEASIMAFGAPVYGRAKAEAWARLGWEFRRDLLGDRAFWVAEQEGRLLGVGGWSPDGMEAELGWLRYLFVDPEASRRGIGRRLVETAEASAVAAGRTRLRVWSSLNAIGFYRAVGYLEERRARWPIRVGVELDHVLMSKRLAGASSGAATGR